MSIMSIFHCSVEVKVRSNHDLPGVIYHRKFHLLNYGPGWKVGGCFSLSTTN